MNKKIEKREDLIPPGVYCYHFIKIDRDEPPYKFYTLSCPYLEIRADQREQENGYCYYLEKGDWEEDGTFLLWDGCKECGLREEDGYDEETDSMDDSVKVEWAEKMLEFVDDPEQKERVVAWIAQMKAKLNS